MSKNYVKIKLYFERGLFTLDMVRNLVGKKNGITADEFHDITGETY